MIAFDKRYRDVKRYKMELPDGVHAFFLLNAANLSPASEKLSRAKTKLTSDAMKDKIQKIFGTVNDDSDAAPEVKEEVVRTRQRKRKRSKRRITWWQTRSWPRFTEYYVR